MGETCFLWRIRGLVAPPCPFPEMPISRNAHLQKNGRFHADVKQSNCHRLPRGLANSASKNAEFDVLFFQKDRKHSIGLRAVLVGICVHSPSYSGKNAPHRDRSEEPR